MEGQPGERREGGRSRAVERAPAERTTDHSMLLFRSAASPLRLQAELVLAQLAVGRLIVAEHLRREMGGM